MNAVTADPMTADVATAETSASSSFGDLTTAGPSVTLSLVTGQKCTVTVSARIDSPASLDEGFMSFAVSGTQTQAASDANAARLVGNSAGAIGVVSERSSVFTATATGSNFVFTAKYRRTGGSFTFRDRRIVVKKW